MPDFSIACSDGEYHFPDDYLEHIFHLVKDYKEETQALCLEVPFTKAQLKPLLSFTASLHIEAATNKEWQEILILAGYFQMAARFERIFVEEFMRWLKGQRYGMITFPGTIRTLQDCHRELQDKIMVEETASQHKKRESLVALYDLLMKKKKSRNQTLEETSSLVKFISYLEEAKQEDTDEWYRLYDEAVKELESL